MSELLKDALAEIGHPSVKDRSNPSWDYEVFNLRYGEIRDYAVSMVGEAASLEHLLSDPVQRHLDLASAYIVVMDQWRRCQNCK